MSILGERLQWLAQWMRTDGAWRGVELATCREAVLRRFTTESALVDEVTRASGDVRDELIGALVRQARRSPAKPWSALLLLASRDWLEPLSARWEADAASAEDIAATVATALLEVVCRAGREARGARVGRRWLKVRTRRLAIGWLRASGDLPDGEPDEPRRRSRRRASGRARSRMARLQWRGTR